MKLGPESDRGQTRQRAAQSAPCAATIWPRKRSLGHVNPTVLARPRPHFGPEVVPLAPFFLVPINNPWGFQNEYMQCLG